MTGGVFCSAGLKEREPTMSKSPITTRAPRNVRSEADFVQVGGAGRKKFPPVHPGRILAEDLRDARMSMNQLAKAIEVPMNRISAIVNGRRGISGDTALRLAHYWGTTAEYWMNLECRYQLELAREASA